MYVAHVIAGEGQDLDVHANVTTGQLTPLGTPADVPVTPPATGGSRRSRRRGRGTGAGGAGGAPITNANTQTLTFDRGRHFLARPTTRGNVYVYGMATDGSVGSLVSWHAGGNNAHHAVFTLWDKRLRDGSVSGSNLIRVYASTTSPARSPVEQRRAAGRQFRAAPRGVAPERDWLYSINEAAGGATRRRGRSTCSASTRRPAVAPS